MQEKESCHSRLINGNLLEDKAKPMDRGVGAPKGFRCLLWVRAIQSGGQSR